MLAEITFPVSDTGYSQPVVMTLKFSGEKKLNLENVRTGAVKPVIKRIDLDAQPAAPYDVSASKPFLKPPVQTRFDFNALPEREFNLDRVPFENLEFKTSI